MAACYFLGAKQVKSKKNGQLFFPATFLTRNNFGDWSTVTRFCADGEVFQSIAENCSVGDPVVCSLDMSGNLVQCVPHDSFPSLELYTDN